MPTDNQSLSYSLTLYYSYDEDEMDDSPGKTLLMKWLRDGDEEFANDRIKMVPHIEKVSLQTHYKVKDIASIL